MADSDILPSSEGRFDFRLVQTPALIIGGLTLLLLVAGALILQSPPVDALPSRVAVGFTEDGSALVVQVVSCDQQLNRVTLIRNVDDRVVWEVQGTVRHNRSAFVVGQTASPLQVSQPLETILQSDQRFRVEVLFDGVHGAEFLLRDVPPVGVLHQGIETTTEGFKDLVGRQWCGRQGRMNLTGGLAAQLVILLGILGVAATAGYFATFEKST